SSFKALLCSLEIWRNQVKLTCPKEGKWIDRNGPIADSSANETYTFSYTSKGQYRCEYDSLKKYRFYVEGNVCENCFELDGNTLFMVIVGDLLLTIIMMVIVYRCSKKKSPAGPPQPSKGKTSLGPITDSQFRQCYHEVHTVHTLI
uniref:CD3 gamma/delta subunit Ig-like domain-containing protein n=1 Tax=Neolamprologus brichardi TaxID=32507 RepID=A0A3Q4G3S9_NEOBR